MGKLKSLVKIGVALALVGALLKGFDYYMQRPETKQRLEQAWNETRADVIKLNLEEANASLIGTKRAISAKNYRLAKQQLSMAKESVLNLKLNRTGLPKELVQTYDSLNIQIKELEIQIQKESQEQ